MALPGLRRRLLARIRPEITVVEINEHLHAMRMGPLRHGESPRLIGRTAAPRTIGRIVPYPQTDPVDAIFLHDVELIHLRAIDIVELRSTLLHLRRHRDIRALHERRRQTGNRIHMNSRLRRHAPGQGPGDYSPEHQPPQNTFLHFSPHLAIR